MNYGILVNAFNKLKHVISEIKFLLKSGATMKKTKTSYTESSGIFKRFLYFFM